MEIKSVQKSSRSVAATTGRGHYRCARKHKFFSETAKIKNFEGRVACWDVRFRVLVYSRIIPNIF